MWYNCNQIVQITLKLLGSFGRVYTKLAVKDQRVVYDALTVVRLKNSHFRDKGAEGNIGTCIRSCSYHMLGQTFLQVRYRMFSPQTMSL